MMSLEEAITHCEEVAEQHETTCKNIKRDTGCTTGELYKICTKCGKEHRQLAEWLKELKDYRERFDDDWK